MSLTKGSYLILGRAFRTKCLYCLPVPLTQNVQCEFPGPDLDAWLQLYIRPELTHFNKIFNLKISGSGYFEEGT